MKKTTTIMERTVKARNPYAQELRNMGKKIVRNRKGKGSYTRKGKNNAEQ